MYTTPADEEKAVVTVGSRATLPQMYVQNELSTPPGHAHSGPAHLRQRNSSQEIAQEALGSTSLRSTPAYGTPGCLDGLQSGGGHLGLSPDSGILGDYSSTPEESFYGKWKEPAHAQAGERAREDNFYGGRSRHRRRRGVDGRGFESLLNFNLNEKLEEAEKVLLPNVAMIALFVVMFGSVYTFLVLATAVVSDKGEIRNGKYASIEYGLRRRREVLEAEGRLLPDEVTSEDGQVLGGKRASIQYGFDLRAQEGGKGVEEKNELSGRDLDDEIEGLVKKLVEVEAEEVEDAERLEAKRAAKKKVLLDKLRSSGYFATSKVESILNKDEESVDESDEEELIDDDEEEGTEEEMEEVEVEEVEVKPVKKVKMGPQNEPKSLKEKDAKTKKTREGVKAKESPKSKESPKAKGQVKRRSSEDKNPFRKFRANPSPENPGLNDEDEPFRFM